LTDFNTLFTFTSSYDAKQVTDNNLESTK